MLCAALLKFFDHVEVIFSDFAPGAGNDFTSLHDENVLTRLRTEPIGFSAIIDHFFGHGFAVFVFSHLTFFAAQIARKCVCVIIAKFVGS